MKFYSQDQVKVLLEALKYYSLRSNFPLADAIKVTLEAFSKLSPVSVPEFDFNQVIELENMKIGDSIRSEAAKFENERIRKLMEGGE